MKINLQKYFNINALGLSNWLWRIPLFACALYLQNLKISRQGTIFALWSELRYKIIMVKNYVLIIVFD